MKWRGVFFKLYFLPQSFQLGYYKMMMIILIIVQHMRCVSRKWCVCVKSCLCHVSIGSRGWWIPSVWRQRMWWQIGVWTLPLLSSTHRTRSTERREAFGLRMFAHHARHTHRWAVLLAGQSFDVLFRETIMHSHTPSPGWNAAAITTPAKG